MKQLQGTEQLGSLQNFKLTVNWDYLRKEVGYRKEVEMIERVVGRMLMSLSAAYWVISSLLIFLQTGYLYLTGIFNVDSIPKLLAWLVLIGFLYSLYLLRNRDEYLDKLSVISIVSLKESIQQNKFSGEIELSNYMSHSMVNLIDDVISQYGDYFLPELLEELLHYPIVQQASFRVGLNASKWRDIIKQVRIEAGIDSEKWLKKILIESFLVAYKNRFEFIDELAVFIVLLDGPLLQLLKKYSVQKKEIEAIELWARNKADMERYAKVFAKRSAFKPTSVVNRAYTSTFPATLEKFSFDYTAHVTRGNFTMSIAREQELEKVIETLTSGKSSVPIVLGQPGVGKTALLNSLAVRMVVEDVPDKLKDMRLVGLDFSRAFALSGSIDEFKRIVQTALEEVVSTNNVVLVIDDLDELVNIRQEFSAEIVSLLTRVIDSNDLLFIATSTQDGYAQHIKPFKALTALFEPIEIDEPSDELAVQILFDSLPELERRHGVQVSFETFVRIIKLSRNYAFEKVLPDKGLDLLDEAIVRAAAQGLTFVTEQLVDQIVSEKVGVNVGDIDSTESSVLANLEQKIHQRVVGQDAAVKAVASALRRARAGLAGGKRPIASFLFFGPTGVGKTELAKAVTRVYYGDDKLMIRVDMSEYQEERNLGRLLGETVDGQYSGGFLTEAVRSKPYSLILLDEIEKANPRVLDVFLQILDEGHVTDGNGRKISFANTIIIATSNVAANQIADAILAGKSYKQVLDEVTPQIRQFLRIELLNRFDQVVMFKPLLQVDIEQIAAIMLRELAAKMADKGIEVKFSPQLVAQLAQAGYNPIYGARELRRVIQDKVEDYLATQIVTGKLKSGDEIVL